MSDRLTPEKERQMRFASSAMAGISPAANIDIAALNEIDALRAELAASEKALGEAKERIQQQHRILMECNEKFNRDEDSIKAQSAQITALQLREAELTEALQFVYDENPESNYSGNRYSVVRKALDSSPSTKVQERARKLEEKP